LTNLEGYIRDTFGQPLIGIPVEAYLRRQLIGDSKVTRLPLVTDNTGYFETNLKERNATPSNFYLIVIDSEKFHGNLAQTDQLVERQKSTCNKTFLYVPKMRNDQLKVKV